MNTYMCAIRFVRCPSKSLAQVVSQHSGRSVRTAIDTLHINNLICERNEGSAAFGLWLPKRNS